jgi:hypothetical protein
LVLLRVLHPALLDHLLVLADHLLVSAVLLLVLVALRRASLALLLGWAA